MQTEIEKPSSSKKKALQIGAFGLSTLIHFCILFLISGAVIIQGYIPKAPMMAEVVPSVPDEQVLPDEQPTQDAPTTPDEPVADQAPAPAQTPAVTDIITVDTATPNSVLTMSATIPGLPSSNVDIGNAKISNTEEPVKKGAMHSMTSPFGSSGAASDGLVGYFYDLKQTDKKKPYPGDYTPDRFLKVVEEFITKGWDSKVLEPFYKFKKPMTTYQIFLPQMSASDAPQAFGVEKDVEPKGILVHYEGTFIAPKSGTFRFVGDGDDILYVRLNKKTQLAVGNPMNGVTPPVLVPGQIRLFYGDWFHLAKGETYSMEVLIGECPGGSFHAYLMIEDKASPPALDPGTKSPLLPVFQTAATKIPKYPAVVEERFNPKVAEDAFVCTERPAASP